MQVLLQCLLEINLPSSLPSFSNYYMAFYVFHQLTFWNFQKVLNLSVVGTVLLILWKADVYFSDRKQASL